MPGWKWIDGLCPYCLKNQAACKQRRAGSERNTRASSAGDLHREPVAEPTGSLSGTGKALQHTGVWFGMGGVLHTECSGSASLGEERESVSRLGGSDLQRYCAGGSLHAVLKWELCHAPSNLTARWLPQGPKELAQPKLWLLFGWGEEGGIGGVQDVQGLSGSSPVGPRCALHGETTGPSGSGSHLWQWRSDVVLTREVVNQSQALSSHGSGIHHQT